LNLAGRGALDLNFMNANSNAPISGLDRKASESNYFSGSDPSYWRTHVANYGRLLESGLYPGIDLLFYGNGANLECDFLLAPGADSRLIRIHLQGQEKLAVGQDGSLKVKFADGDLTFQAPIIYQDAPEGRQQIEGRFLIIGKQEVGFKISRYDHSRQLVIDPILSYSTYIAASSDEETSGVAVDQAGNVYVTGLTKSSDFPTKSSIQPTCGSYTPCATAFLTKLNSAGQVVYSTYIAGEGNYTTGIAIDSKGNAILTGAAGSQNFPTLHSYTTINSSNPDAFVLSISPDGSELNYSTLLGEVIYGPGTIVAVDQFGSAYVTGQTFDSTFPVTPGVLGNSFPSYPQGTLFITKLGSDGTILYSTPVPGNVSGGTSPLLNPNQFIPSGIAVDSGGDVYISGQAGIGLPTTTGVLSEEFPNDPNGGPYGFAMKLNPTASTILYATYLPYTMSAKAIAPLADGSVYVAGEVDEPALSGTNPPVSLGFTTTPGAFQSQIPLGKNCTCGAGYVAHLNAAGSAYLAATLLTGTPGDSNLGTDILSLALDPSGSVWVGGITGSYDFPLKNPIVGNFTPGWAAGFITQLSGDLTSVPFSTFMNGVDGWQPIYNLFLAPATQGVVWTAGTTYDADFPTTTNAFEPSIPNPLIDGMFLNFSEHTFASRIDTTIAAASTCLSSTKLKFPDTLDTETSKPVLLTIQNCGNADLHVNSISIAGQNFSQTNTCSGPVAPGQSCSITLKFTPSGTLAFGTAPMATLLISDDASYSPQAIYLSGLNLTEFLLAPVSPPNLTATVQPGQSATYQISVTGGPGYSGAVAMNCYPSVPSTYSCNIENNFLQVQSGTTSIFRITVAPGQASSTTFRDWKLVTPIFCGLLMLTAVVLYAFSMKKRADLTIGSLAGWLVCIGLLATLTYITGCGGGASGSSKGPTVTYGFRAVAADVSQNGKSLNLTLNVQQ
jgi:hypothetical protein